MDNCQGNGSIISETVTRSISFGNSWSVDGSVGLTLGPLEVGGGGGWSTSSSVDYSKSIGISVSYGQTVG